jgi:hypothetical protein
MHKKVALEKLGLTFTTPLVWRVMRVRLSQPSSHLPDIHTIAISLVASLRTLRTLPSFSKRAANVNNRTNPLLLVFCARYS